LFVPIRVSFLGFSGAEGPGSCGTVPVQSFLTLWQTDDLCSHKALGWLSVGRVAVVVAVAAVASWRFSYLRDRSPE
jgi:hypothetical protein